MVAVPDARSRWLLVLLLVLTAAALLLLLLHVLRRVGELEGAARAEAHAELEAAKALLTREGVDRAAAPLLRVVAARLATRGGEAGRTAHALELACLAGEGRLEEAVRQGGRWLEAAGGDTPLLRWRLALALLASGRAPDAVEELERVVAALPDLPASRHRLGAAYALVGRQEDALRTLQEAVEAGAGPGASLDLARSLSATGRHADATPHLEVFLASHANHPEALRLLAKARFHLGQPREAATLYELSWQGDREPRSLVSAAVAWRQAGDEARARAVLQQARAAGVKVE